MWMHFFFERTTILRYCSKAQRQRRLEVGLCSILIACMEFPSWLVAYRPLVPLKSLVTEINSIYHSFDATKYDAEHAEIRLLWPGLWTEMIDQLPQRDCWRVLDFGCGTGFEAEQLLRTLGSGIDFLVAYDPSEEMLARAKKRLRNNPKVIFSERLENARAHGPYNLLTTNSVLHHLADIDETIFNLQPFLSDDAYWLCGNEPSSRFYKNVNCIQLFEQYAAYRKRTKWFQPARYIAKIKSVFGMNSLSATAGKALERGLFATRPSETAIARLVDFHVHHLSDDVNAGRGLDLAKVQSALSPHWSLRWHKTYSYLGAFSELGAPQQWRDKSKMLKAQFPEDGANFCAVWFRAGTSTVLGNSK
jgi:SAM-dependent methyltransferase